MINWVGGKGQQAKWIISHFPEGYENMVYVEPFGGAGWVLINKKPSLSEVYNDIDDNLVNLFRVVRDEPKKFFRLVDMTLRSKAEKDLGKVLLDTGQIYKLDNLHRALYFALTYVLSYGGYGNGFRRYKDGWVKNGKKAGGDLRSFRNKIMQLHERLKDVTIENLDWKHCIELYDSPNTLFYVDPPYFGKNLYRFKFTEKDHKLLRDILYNVKGKFILSYYLLPVILEWYDGFNIDMKKLSTTVNDGNKRVKQIELLIMNYNL